ncbi:hypothetical protein NF27_HS00340 [Candidatus Jidaibacter acanthamoeba]|uniref:HemY N-terminal domain-containing protein n=1 Tax=Candidatus Jidaibacter acanthamoebae TaxID=86105 RepID=A0A0C1MR10_9RICK|nr:heme biosynthesis HemY N-terminal domain-containing protein [Candidatus Jidaibacter acanthamoeba]KIE04447.1 hypothetical protein NF27_HS00340 [Candidatus Jidaibacter acanthamoeba]
MIRIITLIIFIACLTFGFLWLYQNSGNISFDAFGYHVETSFALSVLFLLFFFMAMLLLIRIFFVILGLPYNFKNLITSFYKVNIPLKLEELLVAIYNHNHPKANKALNQLRKHLPENLTNLLASEVALLKEELGEIKLAFLNLSKNDATRIAGIEGLISVAQQENNWNEVITYCNELNKIHKSEWLLSTYIHAFIMEDKWEDLINFIENSRQSSLLAKNRRKQLLGIACYKVANNYFLTRDSENALKYALFSYKHLSDFTPNLILLAKIKAADQKFEDSIKYIKAVWQIEPSFSASDILVSIRKNYTDEKFFKIVKNITGYNSGHYESNLLLAKAALDIGKYEDAFEAISKAIEENYKFRACLIMAEYCQKTHGNVTEVIEWVKRAIGSEIDVFHLLYFWDFNTMNITKFPTNNCFPIARV